MSTETGQPEERLLATTASNTGMPGPLRGETWITLQTRHAQRLIAGRKPSADKNQAGIVGLTRFGRLTSNLYFCARLDDPFADWWLLKVETALDTSATEIQGTLNELKRRLSAKSRMRVEFAESLSPIKVPLTFANPFAYQGAGLLTNFDELVCAILTAKHVGFLEPDRAHSFLFHSVRAVRRAFVSACGFRNQAITRKDLNENSERAIKAINLLGQVPEDVLAGIRRAKHAPPVINSVSSHDMITVESTLFETTSNDAAHS